MNGIETSRGKPEGRNPRALPGFRMLSHEILRIVSRGRLKRDFLPEVSSRLLAYSGCDELELWVEEEGSQHYRCRVSRSDPTSPGVRLVPLPLGEMDGAGGESDASGLDALSALVIQGRYVPASPFVAEHGSLWTGDAEEPMPMPPGSAREGGSLRIPGGHRSLALIPLVIDDRCIGLLQMKSRKPGFFREEDISFYADISQTLGLALMHQYTQIELRERIKEMTCMYGIARQIARPEASFDEILQGIVELLPPAWMYPEVASARIQLMGKSFVTPGFRESPYLLRSDIRVKGGRVGRVEVAYSEERPFLGEGSFLPEERNLIDSIAGELALFYERTRSEEEKSSLQDQLRHADRLATIGQLAAGVAHELNEPLGNILGFAQLAQKSPGLAEQVSKDLDKIITASLHAREIIKKLMTFARQLPPRNTEVDLNRIVDEGLYFFEARCAKAGIELKRKLSPGLPEFTADAGQLNQVLVNLVVNAIQAMPQGGVLTVETRAEGGRALLVVEDTGAGMDEDVKRQIFIPFFTTKDVNEGTGLGLPVVHGIVTSHKGTIKVRTRRGRGSRFEIRLPIARSVEKEE